MVCHTALAMSRRKKKKSPPTSDPKAEAKMTFWERVLGVWLAVFVLVLVGLGMWRATAPTWSRRSAVIRMKAGW